MGKHTSEIVDPDRVLVTGQKVWVQVSMQDGDAPVSASVRLICNEHDHALLVGLGLFDGWWPYELVGLTPEKAPVWSEGDRTPDFLDLGQGSTVARRSIPSKFG